MAIVHVNGHLYYTKSVRQGGRVTSKSYKSYGPALGEYARIFASWDRIEREARRIERMRRWETRREQSEARQAARRVASQETVGRLEVGGIFVQKSENGDR